MGQKTLTSKVRRYLRRYDLRIRLIQDWPKFKICITPFPVSLTRGRTRFWSVVIYLGSRMFFFPMAPSGLVRTASALDRLQRCCWAPNTEGDLGSCRELSSRSISLFECSQRVLQRCFTLPQELKKRRSRMYEIRCRIN